MSERYEPPMTDQARVIQVIETTLTRRGSGLTKDSILRVVRQYWSLDGKLLAEIDPITEPPKTVLGDIRWKPV